MKSLKFLAVGLFFGIVLIKSEAVSWYRIFEMFKFQSFHMYGIIGTAVGLGALGLFAMRSSKIKNTAGNPIFLAPKDKGWVRYVVGGSIFGLGWALAGACPGPMYVLLGTGIGSIAIVILAALAGTLVYGILRDKLPH